MNDDILRFIEFCFHEQVKTCVDHFLSLEKTHGKDHAHAELRAAMEKTTQLMEYAAEHSGLVGAPLIFQWMCWPAVSVCIDLIRSNAIVGFKDDGAPYFVWEGE